MSPLRFALALSVSCALACADDSTPVGDGGMGQSDAQVMGDAGPQPDMGTSGGDQGSPIDMGGGPTDMGGAQVDMGPPPTCPGPPAGVSTQAEAAYWATNDTRVAMGLPCQTMVTTINTAAQNHCDYYQANSGTAMCIANSHAEVMSCSMFTGAQFWDRMSAAGHTGAARFENMHFIGNGAQAVQGWIDSVWHRTPVVSPWIGEHGYGHTSGCDTMDYGRGTTAPSNTVVSYPYSGQTGVPTSFSGNEGPPPPAPPTGWPSGYPVTIFVQNATLTSHTITPRGGSPLDHVWITPADSSLLSTEFVLYAHDPLSGGTTYDVHVSGTRSGQPFSLDFSFTTR